VNRPDALAVAGGPLRAEAEVELAVEEAAAAAADHGAARRLVVARAEPAAAELPGAGEPNEASFRAAAGAPDGRKGRSSRAALAAAAAFPAVG
jgi:hypothetical protein